MKEPYSDTILSIDDVKRLAIPLLIRYGIKRAGLFGSYARSQGTETSDLDFALDVPEDMDFSELMGLQELLKQSLNKDVDIVEFCELKEEMRDNILKDMVILYEKR